MQQVHTMQRSKHSVNTSKRADARRGGPALGVILSNPAPAIVALLHQNHNVALLKPNEDESLLVLPFVLVQRTHLESDEVTEISEKDTGKEGRKIRQVGSQQLSNS